MKPSYACGMLITYQVECEVFCIKYGFFCDHFINEETEDCRYSEVVKLNKPSQC